jgi:HSP20 family protein
MLPTRHRNGMTFSPWNDLTGLRREMDQMLDSLGAFGGQAGTSVWAPPVNVWEDEDSIRLEVELPGIDPDQVDIALEGQVLTVTGEKGGTRRDERENVHLVERRYGRFERSFTVPRGIDPERIEARYERGVLHLALPKPEESKPRRIRIRATEAPAGTQQEGREVGVS